MGQRGESYQKKKNQNVSDNVFAVLLGEVEDRVVNIDWWPHQQAAAVKSAGATGKTISKINESGSM